MWHDSFICLTWLFRIYLTCLICIFSMTYSCVTYSCICVAWLIHRFGITHSYVDHVLCVCVTWLIHIYDNDMTHSCMSHTWCIHTCDLAHWYVWHDTLIRVTWLTHMCHICLICDRTHSYVWHGTLICLTWLWSQRPPPFLFTMFPDQEPCVRGFKTRCDRRISSWNLYTRLFIREHSKNKPPPGGGFLSISSFICFHIIHYAFIPATTHAYSRTWRSHGTYEYSRIHIRLTQRRIQCGEDPQDALTL